MVFNKKFVSVYINSSKLQIVDLSSDKKRVLKFLSLDLPVGLITNYRVSNSEVLSQALSAVWKKMRIKEKTVSLIIPEFSSLIKTFDLPKLGDEDLDEAVRWHAVDFLPGEIRNSILDWKVVGENDGKYQILSASLDKEVLEGYINAFEKAGLLPIKVETPSLCLTDSLPENVTGRLIIYQGAGETVLILGNGKKIAGSSVINPKSVGDLVSTMKKMFKYYTFVKVEEILIGGKGNIQEISAELSKNFDIKISLIDRKISGMLPEQAQEYLVPISSQLKDAYEPSDKNTINLLPPLLVQKYLKLKNRLSMWTLTLFVTLIVWFSFMSVVIIYLYFGSRIGISNQNVPDAITEEQAKILERIKDINYLSQKIINIAGNSYSPEKVLNQIYSAKPTGINITDYFADFETGEIKVKGKSLTRINLIDFKYKLEENGDFSLVSIPISSFEKDKDFEFEMDFSYLPIKSKLPVKKIK